MRVTFRLPGGKSDLTVKGTPPLVGEKVDLSEYGDIVEYVVESRSFVLNKNTYSDADYEAYIKLKLV
jgi:hypothetical protein